MCSLFYDSFFSLHSSHLPHMAAHLFLPLLPSTPVLICHSLLPISAVSSLPLPIFWSNEHQTRNARWFFNSSSPSYGSSWRHFPPFFSQSFPFFPLYYNTYFDQSVPKLGDKPITSVTQSPANPTSVRRRSVENTIQE